MSSSRYTEFNAAQKELVSQRDKTRRLCHQMNQSFDGKMDIARKLFGTVGKSFELWGQFFCEFGINIHIGNHVFINTGCVFLDAFDITLGNNVFIGPNVCLYTSNHAQEVDKRRDFIEYGAAIHIEDDVWIGGNSVVLPGVSIGRGSIIAAGAIISEDIPPESKVLGPRGTSILTKRICG